MTSCSSVHRGKRASRQIQHVDPVEHKCRWQEVEVNPDLADFDQVPLTDDEGLRIEGVYVRGKGCLELREDMFMAATACTGTATSNWCWFR